MRGVRVRVTTPWWRRSEEQVRIWVASEWRWRPERAMKVARVDRSASVEARGTVTPLVLVADDSAPVRWLVGATLEGLGLRVLEAEDGVRAVEMAADHAIDLLVVDDVLAGLSGIEVAAAVREFGETVPVLMLSDYAGGEGRAALAGMPPEAFLRKPFVLDDLQRRVVALLS